MINIIHTTVEQHGQLVYEGTVKKVELAVTLYRTLQEALVHSEAEAEATVFDFQMLTESGWVPFVCLRDGKMITMDDLTFGDIRQSVEEFGAPLLLSVTTPIEVIEYANA